MTYRAAIALLLFWLILAASSHAYSKAIDEAPILVAPDPPSEHVQAHRDPLYFRPDARGKLHVFNERLLRSLKLWPDWREMPQQFSPHYDEAPTAPFHFDYRTQRELLLRLKDRPNNYYKLAHPDFAKDVAWNGGPIKNCEEYLHVTYGILGIDPIGMVNNVLCEARIALKLLGAPQDSAAIEYGGWQPDKLMALVEQLPLRQLIFHVQPDNRTKHIIGIDEAVRASWRDDGSYGGNAVRLEIIEPMQAYDQQHIAKSAYRLGNGLICAPNRPCLCRFSPSCNEAVIGLLAGWMDHAGSSHWLLFVVNYEPRVRYNVPENTSRLFHVIRAPDGRVKLNPSLSGHLENAILEDINPDYYNYGNMLGTAQ